MSVINKDLKRAMIDVTPKRSIAFFYCNKKEEQ